MVFVPVDLDYVRQLEPERTVVFNYTDELVLLVRQAGFGLVIVEGQGEKKIVAVGRNYELVGKCREWSQPYATEIGFTPESAVTAGGWFARYQNPACR